MYVLTHEYVQININGYSECLCVYLEIFTVKKKTCKVSFCKNMRTFHIGKKSKLCWLKLEIFIKFISVCTSTVKLDTKLK